jgi:hypothetical protein
MRLFSRERDPSLTQGSGEGSVSDVLGVASDRIRGIVDAAERAAADISAKVRSSPEMQGDETSRISRERLVAQLADSLVARAEELSRDAANLADVLERASSRLDVSPSKAEREVEAKPEEEPTKPAVIPAAAATPIKPPGVAPSPQNSGANLSRKVSERFQDSPDANSGAASRFKRRSTSTKAPRPAPSRSTEGLRLLATQMAVAGSTHEEIASRLRDEFGVEDATELLGEAPIARKVKESENGG